MCILCITHIQEFGLGARMSSNVASAVVVAAIAAIKLLPIGAAAYYTTCGSAVHARARARGLGSTDTDRPKREHRVGRIRSLALWNLHSAH